MFFNSSVGDTYVLLEYFWVEVGDFFCVNFEEGKYVVMEIVCGYLLNLVCVVLLCWYLIFL